MDYHPIHVDDDGCSRYSCVHDDDDVMDSHNNQHSSRKGNNINNLGTTSVHKQSNPNTSTILQQPTAFESVVQFFSALHPSSSSSISFHNKEKDNEKEDNNKHNHHCQQSCGDDDDTAVVDNNRQYNDKNNNNDHIMMEQQHELQLRVPYWCEENVWRLIHYRSFQQMHHLQKQQQHKEQMDLLVSKCNNDNTDKNNINTSTIDEMIQQQIQYSKDHNNVEPYCKNMFVLFISNHVQNVTMYHQRAASASASTTNRNSCVHWDYHVILVEKKENMMDHTTTTTTTTTTEEDHKNNNNNHHPTKNIFVYDIDTTIKPYPIELSSYLRLSFPYYFDNNNNNNKAYTSSTRTSFLPMFRIVPATLFIQYFASNRQHMYNPITKQYNAPLPPYQCIHGQTYNNNNNNNMNDHDSKNGSTTEEEHQQQNHNLHLYLNFQIDSNNLNSTANITTTSTTMDPQQLPTDIPKEALGVVVTLEQLLHTNVF